MNISDVVAELQTILALFDDLDTENRLRRLLLDLYSEYPELAPPEIDEDDVW